MTVQFQSFQSGNDAGISVIFTDGTIVPLTSGHVNYTEIIRTLTTVAAEDIDEDELFNLVQPGIAVGAKLTQLSERVSYSGGNLFFDGDAIDSSIAAHIIRIVKEGGSNHSYMALVNFLEKISQNPSAKSRESLYDFIIRHGITIDKDGDFYVYKGVNADGTSIHSGFGIVNGVSMNSHLPNEKGSVLEMPRSKVDADTAVGCSTGLHAGTYGYASGFARGMLLLVKVNPRDVVSVPDDCSFKKIRVSRYQVIDQIKQEITTSTYAYDDEDYDDDNDFEDYEESIDGVSDALNDGREVVITFGYTRGDGTETVVSEFTVNDIITSANGDELLLGEKVTGESRTYRVDRITDIDLTVDGIVIADQEYREVDDEDEDEAEADDAQDFRKAFSAFVAGGRDYPDVGTDFVEPNRTPAVTRTDADEVIDLINDGQELYLKFHYVRANGKEADIVNFQPEEVRPSVQYGQKIIVGKNTEDEFRSYRVDRITELEFLVGEAFKTITPDVTVSEVVSRVENGEVVNIKFSYVKADGTERTVTGFEASEVNYAGFNTILVGERNDGQVRNYRTDRISDLEVIEDATDTGVNGIINRLGK